MIRNKAISPPVLLSPMAGITDLPYRNLVNSFGAGLVVSEMVASQEMVQNKPSAQARAELGFDVENTSVQIAGRDPYWAAKCAEMCQANGANIIDINMGCPAKKVTNGYSGSALMKEPDFAISLVKAVVDAVEVPVTLKMRLGWNDAQLNASEIAKRAEQAGIEMITVHGRTRCQFYKGHANWSAIRPVKEAVSIPVIANGDIVDAQTARQAMKASCADGVMIGRGAYGKPWLLAQIASELFGETPPKIPQGNEIIDLIKEHYRAMIDFYGAYLGLRVARKHLKWYLTDLMVPSEIMKSVLRETDPDVVLNMLDDIAIDRVAA